jgi:penicillin-binding protein 2
MVKPPTFLRDERIGRDGLEQYYNQHLRGRHARQLVQLEAGKGYQPVGESRKAVNGETLSLTIDLDFQRQVERILAEAVERLEKDKEFRDLRDQGLRLGATAVVMDPHTGRLHAMASLPNYNPNDVREKYGDWLKDPLRPLQNKAIAERYPPGSTLKPFTGLAALMEGAIDRRTQVNCTGVVMLKGARFRCLNRQGHGNMDLMQALEASCNPFFYHAGEETGDVRLVRRLHQFGMGAKTGIDLPKESAGGLPRDVLVRGKHVPLGETYYMAIGQGFVTATPLQIAVAFAALANADDTGAHMVRPHLLEGGPWSELDEPRATFAVDPKQLALVREGMWRVVQGEHGTGRRADLRPWDPGLEMAGKTGSAEYEVALPGPLGRMKVGKLSHAWMAAYAPFDKPEVVVVVLVPAGNRGGATCAPILRDILRAFFELPETPLEDALG